MKIQVVQLMDRGIPNRERVHLRVLVDTNLKFHILLNTSFVAADSISTAAKHMFWFPAKDVRAGDDVVLFTGLGQATAIPNPGPGSTSHIFYWGLAQTIWNQPDGCAVLLELVDWKAAR